MCLVWVAVSCPGNRGWRKSRTDDLLRGVAAVQIVVEVLRNLSNMSMLGEFCCCRDINQWWIRVFQASDNAGLRVWLVGRRGDWVLGCTKCS